MPQMKREVIIAAIAGFEVQKAKLNTQISELRARLNGGLASPNTAGEAAKPKRRKFSAAARRRMREAQRLRWAKIHGESEATSQTTTEPKRTKRRISPEGLKRIIAATKKRWRLQKAAEKKSGPATKKGVRTKASKKAQAAE